VMTLIDAAEVALDRGRGTQVLGIDALDLRRCRGPLAAEHVVERFTPTGPDTLHYEATVTDPVVYTRPWTIALSLNRDAKFELMEAACHEEDRDLPRLKALKDRAAGKQ